MLSHTLTRSLRPSNFFQQSSHLEQATRKNTYLTVKVHKTKYKSMAKDRRRNQWRWSTK